MLRKLSIWSAIALISFAAINAGAQTIPGISDADLAAAHVTKGCGLSGAKSTTQKIFGSYALAVSGNGHIPESFFPGGAPISADVGVVWCRFNREMSYTSDFLLVRYQAYSSSTAAQKGFDLVVNSQNQATPDNTYTVSKNGSVTLAVRKYGEVMAIKGDTLASTAWYVPTQQPDYLNRKVGGTALVPMMFALLCLNAAKSC